MVMIPASAVTGPLARFSAKDINDRFAASWYFEFRFSRQHRSGGRRVRGGDILVGRRAEWSSEALHSPKVGTLFPKPKEPSSYKWSQTQPMNLYLEMEWSIAVKTEPESAPRNDSAPGRIVSNEFSILIVTFHFPRNWYLKNKKTPSALF